MRALAELMMENRLLKKKITPRRWTGRTMKAPASEEQEIIELVERSSLSVCRTLAQLGIPKPKRTGCFTDRKEALTAHASTTVPSSRNDRGFFAKGGHRGHP